MTVLTEVEGILNSQPLENTSSHLTDPDPITPNLLLMGRWGASLPQATYGSSDLLRCHRWRHSHHSTFPTFNIVRNGGPPLLTLL